MILNRMGQKHSDLFGTPAWPIEALINSIRDKEDLLYSIWDPAAGKGRLVSTLQSLGYDAYGTDIQTGQDFLSFPNREEYRSIITNPPFSLKDQFLKRCYELKVPFALLLPIQALSGIKRSKMYKEHGAQVLVLPKRVDFEYEDGSYKGKPWFSCCWLVHGFNLPKDIDWL